MRLAWPFNQRRNEAMNTTSQPTAEQMEQCAEVLVYYSLPLATTVVVQYLRAQAAQLRAQNAAAQELRQTTFPRGGKPDDARTWPDTIWVYCDGTWQHKDDGISLVKYSRIWHNLPTPPASAVMVPREPTEEMEFSGNQAANNCIFGADAKYDIELAANVYRAMLSASQQEAK
jgi:hypothetical protein